MQKITTASDLKEAILQLESKRSTDMFLLKEQLHETYERLKPINIIKSTLKEAITTPDLKTNVIKAAVGIAAGYVAKKVFVRKSDNPLTKFAGTILEILVANKIGNTNGKSDSTEE